MLADRPHGPRLSASERMRLDELGRRLGDDDPDLASALRDGRPRTEPPARSTIAVGLAVAFLLVLIAGLIGGAAGALAIALTLLATLAGWQLHRRRSLRRDQQSP